MAVSEVQTPPPASPVCPQCGGSLASGVPLGLCRTCLASSWLDDLLNPQPEPDEIDEEEHHADGPRGAAAPVRFGPFELRDQLGRGGMGVVFLAWQHGLQREVALKLVSSGKYAGAEEVQRLRLEAEAAARLNHPGIVAVLDAGEQDGQPWLAMQYVPGGTLSSKLYTFPGHPREGCRLMAQVSHAVHHAHQHGVLHRDLKPGNILLDAEGKPLVSDFGLARLMSEDAGLTLTGRTVGSPAYMAPEAFEGEASVGRDVYALGVILYQILTGRLPFEGSDHATLIRRCMEEEPLRPRVVRADIPRDLEVICLKCLEKEPRDRYASAQALAEDLEAWLDHRPVKARPVSWLVRLGKWSRRHPARAALAASLVLGAAGVGVHFQSLSRLELQAAQKLNKVEREKTAEVRDSLGKARIELAMRQIEHGYLDRARRTLNDLGDEAKKTQPEVAWLNARCPAADAQLIRGQHLGEITAFAFSPDGKLMASAAQDAEIHLWKTESMGSAEAKPYRSLKSPNRTAAVGLGFSADGSRLFAARNGEPRLMEWHNLNSDAEPETVTVSTPRGVWMQRAGLSGPDAAPLISFNGLPGLTAPRPRLIQGGGALELPCEAAFAAGRPDTSSVLCGDFTNGLHLLDRTADGWNTRWSRLRMLYGLTAVTFSRSGKFVATAHTASNALPHIFLQDTTDGSEASLTESTGTVRSVAMAGDQWLAAGGDDSVVRLWDLENPSYCHQINGHERPVRVVAFTPDGSHLVSGDQGGNLMLNKVPAVSQAAGAPLAASEDLSRVAACGYADGLPVRKLVVVETATGHALTFDAPGIPAAVRMENGRATVLCADNTTVRLCAVSGTKLTEEASFTLPPGTQIAGLPRTGPAFLALRAESDSACTIESRTIREGTLLHEATISVSPLGTAQFSPDGTRLYMFDAPRGFIICLSFPELESQWQHRLDWPQCALAVSPDGKRLAWAGALRAGLIDADTRQPVGETMRQPCELVSRLAFAGPERLMLSSFDNTFLFLSPASQTVTLETRRLPASSELLVSREFSRWLSVDLQNRLTWYPRAGNAPSLSGTP